MSVWVCVGVMEVGCLWGMASDTWGLGEWLVTPGARSMASEIWPLYLLYFKWQGHTW